MNYIVPILAVLAILTVLGTAWILTLFSLPGNWFMLLGVALYAYLVPSSWRIDISWWTVAGLLVLASVGELIEELAAAWGTTRAGGSKRAAVLALIGSIAGALVGGIVGVPIPVIGSMVAAVFGAAFGAMAGAMLGEAWKGRHADAGWEVGKGAFWGRLLGTLGKTVIASMMVVVSLLALVVRG